MGIIIRPIQKEDIPIISKWNNQLDRGDFQECIFESIDNLTKRLHNGELFSKILQMLIIESPQSLPVGLIYISFVREGMAKIGIVINSKSRNTGIGRIAIQEISEYLFENYPIVRIEADTDLKNIAAQKVLEYSGFEKEGIMRKYRFHHGRYNDSVLYSKVR